jgi:4-carboxymuconolactone decarboxylase
VKKTLCITLSLLLLITSMPFSTFAKDIVKSTETKNGESYETIQKEEDNNMSEKEKLAVEKFNELYKDSKIPENIANSDLHNIVNNLVYGEIYQQGQLTDKDRELISLVALTNLGTNTLLKTHVYSALDAGLTPVEITEAVYHCTPYVGAAKALESVNVINEVFKEKGLAIPTGQGTVTEENRWDKGREAQTDIFGALNFNKPAEDEVRLGSSYLPDYCFGDFYTRNSLTLEQHELLTFVCIATLGGCESQLTAHTNGNKNLGKTKDYMLEVITVCMPYIGYPRTLNAVAVINSVYEAENN